MDPDDRPSVALDLGRMSSVRSLDVPSSLVTVGPGMRGPALEEELSREGLTFGHLPQSWEFATLGGYAATRSAGQNSTGVGRFDELVTGLTLATPSGVLEVGHPPASAAGPDLLGLALGSEGTLGVITELTLRVRPKPASCSYEGWSFRTWPAGLAALQHLARHDLLPDIVRLSDTDETRANLLMASGTGARALRGTLRTRGHGEGCLLVLGWKACRRWSGPGRSPRPFTDKFSALDDQQRTIYLCVLVGSVVTTCMIVVPVAFHRILFRQHEKSWLVRAANTCARAGLALLALVSSGVVLFVFDVVLGITAGLVASALVFALFVGVWLGNAADRTEMNTGRRRFVAVAVTVVALVLTSCTVKEPDAGAWRDLAQQSLDDVASEVATVRLTLIQLDEDQLPSSYGETVIAEAEKAASTSEETLSSVQAPPGLRARADQVLALIGRAVDAVRLAREKVVAGRFHAPVLVRKLNWLQKALDQRRANL